jgi:hypothetical protein
LLVSEKPRPEFREVKLFSEYFLQLFALETLQGAENQGRI